MVKCFSFAISLHRTHDFDIGSKDLWESSMVKINANLGQKSKVRVLTDFGGCAQCTN